MIDHINFIWDNFSIGKPIINRKYAYSDEFTSYNRLLYKYKKSSYCFDLSLLCELLFKLTFPESYNKLKHNIDKVNWMSLYPNTILILYDLCINGVAYAFYPEDLIDFSYINKEKIDDKMLIKVIGLISSKLQHYKELKEVLKC